MFVGVLVMFVSCCADNCVGFLYVSLSKTVMTLSLSCDFPDYLRNFVQCDCILGVSRRGDISDDNPVPQIVHENLSQEYFI